MVKLKRAEAIRLIKYYQLLHLSDDQKGNIIYPENQRVYNNESDSWDVHEINKYSNNKYVLRAFEYCDLVTNKYIEHIFYEYFKRFIEIIDNKLVAKGEYCPCCRYKVYKKFEQFDVCPVCMWEYTNTGENEYSSPNHSTLTEYRSQFLVKKQNDINNLLFIKFHLEK